MTQHYRENTVILPNQNITVFLHVYSFTIRDRENLCALMNFVQSIGSVVSNF